MVRTGSASEPVRGDARAVSDAFTGYYRCPAGTAPLVTGGEPSEREGYFAFGGSICYGRPVGAKPSSDPSGSLADVAGLVGRQGDRVVLPFDFSEVVTNLRQERYRVNGYPLLERITSQDPVRHLYYFLRPMLHVGARKHLQRIRLSGWERIRFPRWPVDATVDSLMNSAMALVLESTGMERIPFVWFWPDGASSCAMMTHDVEGEEGRRFCDELMDLDEAHGIKSAFQLVPQGQEAVWKQLASRMRGRGFEVNLHDLNHDGYLFHNKKLFLERAREINRYAAEFDSRGFRSGAMYRQQAWFEAFEFAYDMSVPNVAHLEPQRGGCCTVMPYFVGNILELPLTTLQDYSLFHIIGDYSIAMWRQQIDEIVRRNGLVTLLAHPDYIREPKALGVYTQLLQYLRDIRSSRRIWAALPGDVNRWWRNRERMALVPANGSWRIEGPDSDRARLAYARATPEGVVYELHDPQ